MALHPFIADLLKATAARPALSAGTPDQARAMLVAMRPMLGQSAPMATAETVTIPTGGGGIPGLLLIPGEGEPAGLVVFVHGGGWVLGEIEDYEIYARALAAASGCAVLVPAYRLAPEFPFPAGLDDVEDTLTWVAQGGVARLAGLPLVVGGDSAGGNLATVALRRLRDTVRPVFQFLIYPVCDTDMTRGSYGTFALGYALGRADMAWFLDHYAPPERHDDPDIAPLRAADLSGQPPTVMVLASHDVLHDEGLAYAAALRAAGVTVNLRIIEGVTHGFIRLHNLFDLVANELQALADDIAGACAEAGKVTRA